MEYMKNLMFWKKESEIKEKIADGLTDEQKNKYRKQYMKLAYNTFILSLVYILGVISLISNLFMNNQMWTIAVVVVLLRDYVNLTDKWGHESELIIERINKRKAKNRKKVNSSFEKNLKENEMRIRGED
jgi:hypothetical protein